MFWWWPYVHHKDLYYRYKALGKFVEGEDRRGKNYQLAFAGKIQGNVGLGIVGMQNHEEAFLWLYEKSLFEQNAPIPEPMEINFGRIYVDNLNPGNYIVQFWDTIKGEVFETKKVENESRRIEFDIPSFKSDIACKIKKEESL